jgi:DNA-binding transcriptional ArsR family regulator
MDTKHAIDALGALAHEHRLAIYRMLVEAGPTGLSAGTIAERLGVPPSSLTFHTRGLVHAGLAMQHRISRQLIYTADFAAMNDLVGYLTENCCGREVSCAPVCKPASSASATDAGHTMRRSS